MMTRLYDGIWRESMVTWLEAENQGEGTQTNRIESWVIVQWKSHTRLHVDTRGGGLLSQFPPFPYFPHFSALWIYTLAIEYHVYIWQVSPQLSCGDTCQIWMWLNNLTYIFLQDRNFFNLTEILTNDNK